VIFTRIAWVAGLLLVVALCWLAIRGLTTVVPFLVTGLVLVILIGGGNVIHGRGAPPMGGREPPGEPERPGRER
jgi:hypothetical protein